MPSIKYKGMEIYFDTLSDAMAAVDAMAGSTITPDDTNKGKTGGGDGRWTVSRFKDYTGRLSKQQLQMLQELVKSPHGRTAKDLAPALGFDSAKAFGPVLAAMSRHAKNAGIAFDEVMRSDRVDVGRDRILEFRAMPGFVKIAAEAGWKVGE